MGTPATIPPPPPGYGPVSVVPPPPPGYGPVSVVPGGASAPAAAAAPAPPPPTDAPSLWQRTKQHIAENIDSNLQPTGGIADDVVGGLSRGFAKGGLQTVGGLLDIYRKMGSDSSPDTKAAADWFRQHSNTEGFWEGMGSGGEALAEFLGTEGVGSLVSEAAKGTEAGAKVLGVADRLKSSGQVASFLTANPKIAKLAAIGMRVLKSGAEAGAQTYVKSGGDAGTAAEGAALGMAGGAAVEGVSAAARGAKSAAMSTLERLARPGEMHEAVTNSAKGIVADELNATNSIRNPPTVPKARAASSPNPRTPVAQDGLIRTTPEQGLGAIAPEAPTAAAAQPETPGLASPPPGTELAKRNQLGEPGPPPGPGTELAPPVRAIGAPATEEEVGARYKRMTPDPTPAFKWSPIDVQKAVSETGSFADASERMKEAAKPIYDHLNKISNGEWQTDWNNLKEAKDKLSKLSRGVDDAEIANQTVRARTLELKIRKVIKDPASGLTQEDVNQATRNFRTHYLLDEAHRRIASIYDVEAGRPLKSGTLQGIGTSRVGEQWRQFVKDNPDAREVIGGDRVDTLQRLFDSNETRASRRQIGTAIYSIARHIVPGGHGVVGRVADGAIRKVIHGLIADPKTAKSLMFAIDSGAKPENYAPGLAKMIRRKLINAAIPAAASTMAHD